MTNTTTMNADTCAPGCQLLTVKELAGLLKMHPGTLWRLSGLAEAGHGDFPRPVRIGPKTVRWRFADVQKFLDRLAKEGGR